MVGLGLGVLWLNVKAHTEFGAYCKAVAAAKGELDLLASPLGGADMGYNGYMSKLHEALCADLIDPDLPPDLREVASRLGKKLRTAQVAAAVFVVLLIVSGLIFGR